MLQVAILGLAFVGSHFVLSLADVRGPLVKRLGENGFLGSYSLVSAVLLVLLVMSYGEVSRAIYWWYPDPGHYTITMIIMWFAVVLLVGAFMAPNPSSVGAGEKAKDGPRGMLRITRHPLMWGIGLWGLAHILSNGDVVSVVFFSWFVVLSLGGAAVLDGKKKAQLGEDWVGFCAQTSLLPFAAIVTGRARLVVGELVGPVLVGSVVYGGIFWGHEWLSGVEILWP